MILVAQSGTQLRAYEEPMLEKYFGPGVIVVPAHGHDLVKAVRSFGANCTHVYWRPDTERTTHAQWMEMRDVCRELDGVIHINHPDAFDMTQCKDRAWQIWASADIPVVPWKYHGAHDRIKYPCLLRLNNSTSARETVYATTQHDVLVGREKLRQWHTKPRYGSGIDCHMIEQDFIETLDNGYRWSYRIIVAGANVVTGYARPALPPHWVATMAAADWTPGMAEVWLEAQIECERWMFANADEIIKAVKVLGLDFQGVDVIREADWTPNTPGGYKDASTRCGKHYYLEVQPGFAAGYLNAEHKGWHPPYYNPSKPTSFVKWLVDNEADNRLLIPLYYDFWLDKERLFDSAFGAIARTKGGE